MTPEFLSRLQFALTISFHFEHLFPGKVRLTGDSC